MIIIDYNANKGGVDTMDQNVEVFNCVRKTVRWPMVINYNMLNIATNNAYILMKKRAQGYALNKSDFIKNLSFQLAKRYVNSRYPVMKPDLKGLARKQLFVTNVQDNRPAIIQNPSRKRCHMCSKTSRTTCRICNSGFCPQHRRKNVTVLCNNC